jgi:hypothetical protein
VNYIFIKFHQISNPSILYNELIKAKRNKTREYSASSSVLFKFREIGEVIESTMGGLFQHRFTQKPLCLINTESTKKVLDETVINPKN